MKDFLKILAAIIAVPCFLFLLVFVGLNIYQAYYRYEKSKLPHEVFCGMSGLWDMGEYLVDFSPKLFNGCESYQPKEVRFLDTYALRTFIPANFIVDESRNNKNEILYPLNLKREDTDIKVSYIFSNHRMIMPIDERIEMEKSHFQLREEESKVSWLRKFRSKDQKSNPLTTIYIADLSGSREIITCITLPERGSSCSYNFNIIESEDKNGLVEVLFHENNISQVNIINAYSHALINSMIKEK